MTIINRHKLRAIAIFASYPLAIFAASSIHDSKTPGDSPSGMESHSQSQSQIQYSTYNSPQSYNSVTNNKNDETAEAVNSKENSQGGDDGSNYARKFPWIISCETDDECEQVEALLANMREGAQE